MAYSHDGILYSYDITTWNLKHNDEWKKPDTKENKLNDPSYISTKKAELIYGVKSQESSYPWVRGRVSGSVHKGF